MKNSKKVKSPKLPKYRKQKKNNGAIAFVDLNGQRFYLGEYGSPESETQYYPTAGGMEGIWASVACSACSVCREIERNHRGRTMRPITV